MYVRVTVQKSSRDVSHFDSQFTREKEPPQTPVDRLFLMSLDQTEFAGFEFVNPQFLVAV